MVSVIAGCADAGARVGAGTDAAGFTASAAAAASAQEVRRVNGLPASG
nr:hypothetical protein [Arthrobacter sp. ZGTC412]